RIEHRQRRYPGQVTVVRDLADEFPG
ncbi:MAG: hypothetical protein QOC94_1533, partial [Actinoplanes sp.]|nr:hypothetical protein [Actinoplanes sp.]